MGTVPCLVGHLAESLPFTLLDTSGASLPIRDNQKHLQTLLECPWGGGDRPHLGPTTACVSATAAGGLPCGALGTDRGGNLQLRSPHTTSPGIHNNSARDCLFPLNSHDCAMFLFQLSALAICLFSLAKATAQSNHQKMINTVCLC